MKNELKSDDMNQQTDSSDTDIVSFQAKISMLIGYADQRVIPSISRDGYENERESAIAGTYWRMFGWMKCLDSMRDPAHFQGVAAGARALFELLLDMRMLANDHTGESARKFHAFTELDKLRSAEKQVEFYESELKQPSACKIQREFLDKNQARINEDAARYWRNGKGVPFRPNHWSGFSKPEKRVEAIIPQYHKLFIDHYKLFSWYVHSGSMGYAGLQVKTFKNIYCLSLGVSCQIFAEATQIISTVFDIK
jgi:hypothetical protein